MASELEEKKDAGLRSERLFFDILMVVFVIALLWAMKDALTPLLVGAAVLLLGLAQRQKVHFDAVIVGIASVFLGVWFFSEIASILWPFVTAFILAYLLSPMVRQLQKFMPRNVAIAVIVLSILAVLTGLGAVVIPKVISEVSEFVRRLPTYGAALVSVYDGILVWVEAEVGYAVALEDIQQWLLTRLPEVGRVFADQTTSALKGFSSGIAAFLNLLMIPFVTFYILKDYEKIGGLIERSMPPRYLPPVKAFWSQIDDVLGHYIRGQMLVCSFIALLTALGLGVLGIRYAVLLGLMAGLFNLVPFIGLTVSLVISALIAGLDADPVMGVVKVVVVFVIVQGIEGNFLSPKVVGQRVGLHPGWVMFALVLFAHFWGFIGMVIAIPVAAVINILVRIVANRYFNSHYYQRATNDETS